VVGGGGGSVGGRGLGVDSGALVGHIGDIAVISVGGVLHVLDSAVGKSDRVSSGHVAGAIRLLLGVEVRLGVVISDGVGEGVGGDLISVSLSLVGGGGVVSRGGGVVSGGGVHHGGVIGGGGVHGVSNGVGDHGGVDSVVDWGVDGVNSVGNNSISSVKSVGGISHDGGVGSEGLALGGGPVLSLVGLAHGLVADLAVSVSVDGSVSSIVDGGHSSGHGSGQDGGVHSGVVTHNSVVSNSVVESTMEKLGGSRSHGGQGETHKSLHVCDVVLSR